MWIGTYMCKQLSVNISLFGVCNVCVPFVSWWVDRDLEQPAQMGNSQSSLYASDLLPWGYQTVMVAWVVCSLFGKLQKLLNERGADLPLYRTRLWLHTCCRYSNNREKGNCTDMHACPRGVRTHGTKYFRAPVQSCVYEEVYIPLKRTRSTSKTHLNGMTGYWARHLQQVLSAGNSMLWIMFTTSQCEGPPYLHCWAESLRSGIVLWLFGIYLVIRPLKSSGRMKASALLNLLLLAYFV